MSRESPFLLAGGGAVLITVLLAGARLAPAVAPASPQWSGHHHGRGAGPGAAAAYDDLARHLEAARAALSSARRETAPERRSAQMIDALAQLIDAVDEAAWLGAEAGHDSGHHSGGVLGYHHDGAGCGD